MAKLTSEQQTRFKQFFAAYRDLFAVLKEDRNEGEASDLAYTLAGTAVPMSDDELKMFRIEYAKWSVNGGGFLNY
jgi:hypothetical protein